MTSPTLQPPSSNLDYAPNPGQANSTKMVLKHAAFELGLTLRNGEQILLTLILPIAAMIGLKFIAGINLGAVDRMQVIVPGTIALAILATAFASQAISTGFDRRYGVIKLLGTTPLTRTKLLAAKTLAILAIELIQIILILLIALPLGWQPQGNFLATGLFVILGTACFSALALALAGTLRAEATLAVANAVFLLLMFLGGVMVPLTNAPTWLAAVGSVLPSGALGDGLRTAMGSGTVSLNSVLVLAIWGVIGTLLTSKFFTWE